MHHSKEIINPKSYAIGVLFEYEQLLLSRFKDFNEDEKDAYFRVSTAISILNNAFLDELTFERRLQEFADLQKKALAIIERQRKEIENLKHHIK